MYKGKILVIDDDANQRENFQYFLEDGGYEVVTTPNGNEGIKIIKESIGEFDALLLDLMMPEIDGIEVLRKLKIDSDKYLVRIIVVTAVGDNKKMLQCLEMGAHDFIIKPYRKNELLARVGVHSKSRQMERKIQQYASEMEELARIRAQQLVQADRLATIGTLSAGIAHELKNPLFYISGSRTLIEQDWNLLKPILEKIEDEEEIPRILREIPEMIEAITKGVDRINTITKGLKDFSRKESGEKEYSDISEILEESMEICSFILKKNVKVEINQDDHVLPVFIVKQKIEQVIINLINNSVQAMEGNGLIRIGVTMEDEFLKIIFEDSGPGFSDDLKERIFDSYYTTKSVDDGTGLGLSICRNIIKEHNGEISAENITQGGARFIIKLPVNETSDK